MIYFMQVGVTLGPVKIGYAEDPEQRRRTLQTAHAERVHIIAMVPGDRARERRLHARFAEGRLNGEWFRWDTPGLQDFLSDAIHVEGFPDDRQSPASVEVLTS